MDAKNYIILNPADIETRSFEIITEELGHLNLSPELAPIVKRVVHTTADFDYARITEIQSGAVASAVAALVAGCKIYSDTRMIIAGVSKPMLKKLNCELYTYVDDAGVATQSKEKGSPDLFWALKRQ